MANIIAIKKIKEILKDFIDEASPETIQTIFNENLNGEITYIEDGFFNVNDEAAKNHGLKY